jgi:hypothetical protein
MLSAAAASPISTSLSVCSCIKEMSGEITSVVPCSQPRGNLAAERLPRPGRHDAERVGAGRLCADDLLLPGWSARGSRSCAVGGHRDRLQPAGQPALDQLRVVHDANRAIQGGRKVVVDPSAAKVSWFPAGGA